MYWGSRSRCSHQYALKVRHLLAPVKLHPGREASGQGHHVDIVNCCTKEFCEWFLRQMVADERDQLLRLGPMNIEDAKKRCALAVRRYSVSRL